MSSLVMSGRADVVHMLDDKTEQGVREASTYYGVLGFGMCFPVLRTPTCTESRYESGRRLIHH